MRRCEGFAIGKPATEIGEGLSTGRAISMKLRKRCGKGR